jgi:imidazolonepropionase-like amidohydrolase
MKRVFPIFMVCFLLAGSSNAQEWSTNFANFLAVDAPVVAIENVTIIDGTGAGAVAGQTVVIRDGMIESVGTGTAPDGAHVIDGSGKTLIPGMVGLHNHTFYTTSQRRVQLDFSAPRMYLASGVTTIRTTGSYAPYSELGLKRSVNSRQRMGPRMFVTGPYIDGQSNAIHRSTPTSPDAARRVVKYWSEEGVDWFKVYANISSAELSAVIDEAHTHGIKVTGHLCSVTYREAVVLGIDNLEHGLYANSDYSKTKVKDECPADYRRVMIDLNMSGEAVQTTFREMIAAGVGMTSTLAIYEHVVPNRPPVEQRVLDAMSPEVQKEYLRTRTRVSDRNSQLSKDLWIKALEYEKAFVEAGGLLASGVDPTGYGGALPGYGDQRNYELLHEAGFNSGEVVQIMSLNGAKILGIDEETGSIEAGKHADLILINGDLASDPALIRNVEIVFRDGVGFDSVAIIESIEGQVGVR